MLSSGYETRDEGWTLVITQILTNSRQVKRRLGFLGFCRWKWAVLSSENVQVEREKWAHRLVLCGLDRPTHFGVKAEQTKEKCKNVKKKKKLLRRKRNNKFHRKFGNYSEVRAFEEDTAAKRKPHHLVLSWHIMEMRDLPHLALLALLDQWSDSPNTLITNAPLHLQQLFRRDGKEIKMPVATCCTADKSNTTWFSTLNE